MAASGAVVEGGEPVALEPIYLAARRAHSMLANGMGGIDWAGLEVVAALLRVDDIERLVECMHVIRWHKPDQ